jgi:hypothetical protein
VAVPPAEWERPLLPFEAMKPVDARLRVLYLIGVAVGIFFLRPLWQVAIVLGVQCVLWFVVGLPARGLLRQIVKLWGFALFLLASYALTSEDPAIDRWVHVDMWRTSLAINVGGALVGLAMIVRVIAVVLASQIARAGDARAVATGLGKLGVPRIAAASIDAVLALLGQGGGGRGGGRNRPSDGNELPEKFWASVKRLGRGDVAPIVSRLERQIARAEEHAEQQGAGARGKAFARDVGIIAGVTLTMLGIKALKILPSIPFAPGHKLVLLTPLYIVASLLTATRFGGTLTGLTMGTVAFLLGDGKYGIFEILKHVTPGVICDLCVPLMVRGDRMPGGFGWSVFGTVVAAGRVTTILAIVFLVQAPKVAYAMLLPAFAVHCTFGAASGYISYHVVRGVARLRQRPLADEREALSHERV